MGGFAMTYCSRCENDTAHDIYTSDGNYLHSLCVDCGKDVSADARLGKMNGEATKQCARCEAITYHIRYISDGDYIHWLCCSCGKDIVSDSRGR